MIGKTVGHYLILQKLGSGGMGEVWLAEDTRLERKVALKFLPSGARTEEEQIRFIREAQAASAMDHPNICTVYEIDETEDSQTYIAMAYYEGETLRERISRGPLKLEEALDIAIQTGEGLARAHKEGIVHRDIKPANTIITKDGTVKIVDLGLAKRSGATQLTKTGATMGTAAYMSPEQIRGEEVDHRADVWALGVMTYEMVTGQSPFTGENEVALTYAILNKTHEPVAVLRMDAPVGLDRIIDKAMTKDQGERYRHVDELLADLRQVQKKTESESMETEIKESVPSIAVLPFTNMSADPEQEYFCDGMAEEIINALTHIERLRVIARTSAFSFKDKHEDVREIGRKLDVETLLEGSVRKADNRIRITAQLVRVSDGSHLWSERYDCELKDIFDIQDEISLAIVGELSVKLLGKEKAALLKRHTENLEAYNLYLKGAHYVQMLTAKGLAQAIECFEQSLQKDPGNALVYFGLANICFGSSFWGNVPPYEAYPKARAYTEKALAIDDTLGEAHAALGFIYTHYDWNWKEAERELQQALQIHSNYSTNHLYYYFLLTVTERHEEAITEAKCAQQLDPLSSFVNTHVGHAFFNAGQYDKAIDELQMTLTMDPNYFVAHYVLGLAYRGKSMFEEAIEAFKKAVDLSGGNPWLVTQLAITLNKSGEKTKAKDLFDSVRKRAKQEYVPPMCFCLTELLYGDSDQAFKWLERAYEERDSWLCWWRVVSEKDLRIPDEPRFNALLKEAGFGVPVEP